jgi:HD-like signal output (HDOD) protein
MVLGRTHRAQAGLAIHFTAPDRSKTYIGETIDISSKGFSVQVRTDDPLPPIILAGILPGDRPGEAIVCKARQVWRGGVVRGVKRASYRIFSIAHRSQQRLDQLIQQSLAGLVAELSDFPLFASSSPAELEILLGLGRTRELPAGRTVYEASAAHAGVYIVLAGEVERATPHDRTRHLGPGGIVGRWPGTPIVEATATAITDLRVLYLSPAVAAEAEQRMPQVVACLQEALCQPGDAAAAEPTPAPPVRSRLTRDLLEIPTLPGVFHAILGCLSDPGIRGENLTLIVEREPALAGRLLGVLSTPPIGSHAGVDVVSEAIESFGLPPTANLALTSVLLRTLQTGPVAPVTREIWLHCLAAAHFAEAVAERMPEDLLAGVTSTTESEIVSEPDPLDDRMHGASGLRRQHLFLQGLLHDVGLILMQQRFPEDFARVRDAVPRAGSFDRAERELLEIDHGQIGYRMAKAWRLPEPIPTVIASHHDPERWARTLPDRSELARRLRERPCLTIVALADLLARRTEVGSELDHEPAQIDPAIPEALGLNASDMQAILAREPVVRMRCEALLSHLLPA